MANNTKPSKPTGSAGEAPGKVASSSTGDETTARQQRSESPPIVTITKPSEPSGSAEVALIPRGDETTARNESSKQVLIVTNTNRSESSAPPAEILREETRESSVEKPPTPFWTKWNQFQFYEVTLLEAVALSRNIEPDALHDFLSDQSSLDENDSPVFDEVFDLRFDIAQKVAGDAFKVRRVPERDGSETIRVRLHLFAHWTLVMRKSFPDTWGELPEAFVALAAKEPPRKWPWGNYTTDKLNALSTAVEYFWRDYHDGDERPPKHRVRDVRDYLLDGEREIKITKGVALSIDNIIRPDHWGTGPVKGQMFPRGEK